jgi:YjbE family integral membrane protein
LAKVLPNPNTLSALVSVVIIDVVLAGDNAIVVGMAAARLPPAQRRRIVGLGVGAATVLRILFAYFAARLLEIIGLTLAGGVLLLWVAWKFYRETRQMQAAGRLSAGATGGRRPLRSATAAWIRIVVADVSMSLDNVLAIAGAAREHFYVLAFGLVLSVALMGIAANQVARLLERHFWISWIGLGIVTFVALRMIWDGSSEILHRAAAMTLFGG